MRRSNVVNVDATGKKHTYSFLAYDFDNAAGRAQWIKRATDAVATGHVDGVLIDGNRKNFSAEILKPCSAAKRQSWSVSYAEALRTLARALGPNHTIIANLRRSFSFPSRVVTLACAFLFFLLALSFSHAS